MLLTFVSPVSRTNRGHISHILARTILFQTTEAMYLGSLGHISDISQQPACRRLFEVQQCSELGASHVARAYAGLLQPQRRRLQGPCKLLTELYVWRLLHPQGSIRTWQVWTKLVHCPATGWDRNMAALFGQPMAETGSVAPYFACHCGSQSPILRHKNIASCLFACRLTKFERNHQVPATCLSYFGWIPSYKDRWMSVGMRSASRFGLALGSRMPSLRSASCPTAARRTPAVRPMRTALARTLAFEDGPFVKRRIRYFFDSQSKASKGACVLMTCDMSERSAE